MLFVLVGEPKCGKTTLLRRISAVYLGDAHWQYQGPDGMIIDIVVGRYDGPVDGYLVLFDGASKRSLFSAVETLRSLGPGPKVLVANKIDLRTYQHGPNDLPGRLEVPFFSVSAKLNQGCLEPFLWLSQHQVQLMT